MQPAERFLRLSVMGPLLAGVPRQNSVIYGALTMRTSSGAHVTAIHFNTVSREVPATLFVVPNLSGDSKTT
jgi:hypothetical protein